MFSIKLIFILLNFLFVFNLYAQQSKISKSVNLISEFIASEEFVTLKSTKGHLASVDSIYKYALKINNFDYNETLLSLMFATIPYRKVPIQFPLLNLILYYPLISADEKTFYKKNQNLPRYFFYDSPNNDYGDLDKLAHFFGSAFLSYSSNIFDIGFLIGYFVEVFEEIFKVQSTIDYRDIDVNFYGNLFGKLLQNNNVILPSQIILFRTTKFLIFAL